MSEINGQPKPAPSRSMDVRVREDEGLAPAGHAAPHGGEARTEFFGSLRIPMQSGTGNPNAAYPKGMTDAQKAKVAEITGAPKGRR